MEVGVNYPWLDYGWDFGAAPPGAPRSGNDPNWLARIEGDLALFLKIGISVVRWFILADGLTYGAASDAPHLDTGTGQWRFDPPVLGPELLSHFEQLLKKFSEINGKSRHRLLLMPVFIDYLFCLPGVPIVKEDSILQMSVPDDDWVKCGRADAITDDVKQGQFLQRALQPLLQIASKSYRDVIYAWDIINEPDLVTRNWRSNGPKNLPIDDFAMRAFIEDSKSMIRHFGFRPTIGFSSIESLRTTRISAEINQFHYYADPTTQRPRKLEKNPFSPQFPGIIGEFATSFIQDSWPGLGPQTVLSRLRAAQMAGYPLAIPWSFNDKKFPDPHSSWTPQVEQDIECFVFGRNCPGK